MCQHNAVRYERVRIHKYKWPYWVKKLISGPFIFPKQSPWSYVMRVTWVISHIYYYTAMIHVFHKTKRNHAYTTCMNDHKWASKNYYFSFDSSHLHKNSKLYPFLLSRESQKCDFIFIFSSQFWNYFIPFVKVMVCPEGVLNTKNCFYYATSCCNIVFCFFVTWIIKQNFSGVS